MDRLTALGRKLVDLHNWASDTRFVWFPFLWLKPRPETPITRRKALKMSLLFGFYFSTVFALQKMLFLNLDFLESLYSVAPYFILGFFIWFNAVTVPLWNRRAQNRARSQSS